MSLRDNLPRDNVKALRTLEPVVIERNKVVGDAIALLQKQGVGCIFVTEQDRPIGVFTERDVLTKVLADDLPLDTPIARVMTPDPRVLHDTCSVAEVIKTMHEGGFRQMPVVDGAGRLKGVVSVKRVVEYLVDHFPSAVFNLPPDPAQQPATREGA